MASRKNSRAARPSGPPPVEAPAPRRRFWFIGIAALIVVAIAGFFAWRTRSAPAGPPDIILVTIDTLRADCVSFGGHSKVKTPFLDELARGGIWFENAHAHNVVTLPSHANILTGLLPFEHGIRDNAGFTLDKKFHTVAFQLKKAGYATGAFVGAYPLDARFGLNRDFDVYDDRYREGTAPSTFIVPERPATETLAAAQQWYDSVPAGQKKFLWVHLYEPHAPYTPRSPFREQYPGEPYYGEIASADDALGKFLAPLLERHPNTMVILTSDHGEGRGEHGEETHGLFAYEATLKIPLIVYEKSKIDAHVEKRFVRHCDIAPTILARAGIAKPKEMSGESLLDIRGPRNTYFESLTATLNLGWAPLFGMIHDGYKYIDLPLPELYALPKDPAEKQNLAELERRTTARVRALLAQSAPAAAAPSRNVSADEAKNLMSLGYLTGTAAAKKHYTAADDPKNLVQYYARMLHAVDLYQAGDWKQAADVAQKLVAERPEMTMAADLLAFVLQQNEEPEKAEKLLRDAIASGSASDTMKKRLGLLLSEKGESAEAVQILSQFANTNDPDLLNAYGIALADLGRVQDAVQQFQRTLEIDHTNATALENLGVVATRGGNLAAAQDYLTRALKLNANMPLALNTLGVVYARQNDLTRAVDSWKRAVAIDPRQYDALFNIGIVSAQAGQREDARHALTQFVNTAPPQRYARDIAAAREALARLQ